MYALIYYTNNGGYVRKLDIDPAYLATLAEDERDQYARYEIKLSEYLKGV